MFDSLLLSFSNNGKLGVYIPLLYNFVISASAQSLYNKVYEELGIPGASKMPSGHVSISRFMKKKVFYKMLYTLVTLVRDISLCLYLWNACVSSVLNTLLYTSPWLT